MKRILLTLALSSALGFTGGAIASKESSKESSKEKIITFIHYNDLHANLAPHKDLVRDPKTNLTHIEERGGIARTATLIKQIRKENPNSVAMNIGDTFHGGVEAQFTQGNAIAAPVNAVGFDLGVPGNWDFAYGPSTTRARFLAEDSKIGIFRQSDPGQQRMRDTMRERMQNSDKPMMKMMGEMMMSGIEKPNYPNLAANVTLARNSKGETFLPATFTKEIDGVKVGFIGITSDIVPKMHEMMAIGMTFLEGEAAYVELINKYSKKLRDEGHQIVVVMSELGVQKDYHLAQIVKPGVDVFFSAHTHEATFTPYTSKSGALVVEAGNDGYLGRMDLRVRNGKVVGHKWKLMPITADIKEDPEVKKLVAEARAPFLDPKIKMEWSSPFNTQYLNQPIDTVVGHTKVMLTRNNSLESSFNNLYGELARKTTGASIATTPGFRFSPVVAAPGYQYEGNSVASGEITLEDVYRFFPVSYSIAKAEVSGAHLKTVIEELLTEVYSTDVFKQAGGWVSGFSGVDINLDLSAPDGKRVIDMHLTDNGKLITPNQMISIVGCSRPLEAGDILCSKPGFTKLEKLMNPRIEGDEWTAVDFFIQGLALHKPPESIDMHITDVSKTPVWPVNPFIQPLKGVGK